MAESLLCPFVKIRQGLNKANYYIMQNKKEIVELLKQIFKAQQEESQSNNREKQQKEKKQYNNCKKERSFTLNSFKQRDYGKEDLKNKVIRIIKVNFWM